MKRAILSGFGYYDKDWINPPDDQGEFETGFIDIKFNKEEITFTEEEGVYFVSNDAFDKVYLDEDYDIGQIARGYEVSDAVSEELESYFKDKGYKYGSYYLTGEVSIPYEVYIEYFRNHKNVELNDIYWNEIHLGEIKVEGKNE